MRMLVRVCVSMFAILAAAPAAAQGWPSKPVRIVVPYPPGGGIDILARQLAEKLSPQWGQPVVVENKPGGSTIPGTDSVAKAPPDGHTVLLSTDASFSINPHFFLIMARDATQAALGDAAPSLRNIKGGISWSVARAVSGRFSFYEGGAIVKPPAARLLFTLCSSSSFPQARFALVGPILS